MILGARRPQAGEPDIEFCGEPKHLSDAVNRACTPARYHEKHSKRALRGPFSPARDPHAKMRKALDQKPPGQTLHEPRSLRSKLTLNQRKAQDVIDALAKDDFNFVTNFVGDVDHILLIAVWK